MAVGSERLPRIPDGGQAEARPGGGAARRRRGQGDAAAAQDQFRALSLALSVVNTMAQVLVRQLDDHVVSALRARARAQGLSLEQSLRDLLTDAVRTDRSLRDELARLRASTPAAGRSLDVAALIREDRDGR